MDGKTGEGSRAYGVSSHLRIPLEEYDERIRTFVPYYEEMLREAGRLVAGAAGDRPVFLDLGVGTGALAEVCMLERPGSDLIGIDSDPGMLELAGARLRGLGAVELRLADFQEIELPRVDFIVASLALHHVGDRDEKRLLYSRCREALGRAGIMVLADCFPPEEVDAARDGMEAWRRHLECSYAPREAQEHLDAWSLEDTYFDLPAEIRWMTEAGFRPEVTWRRDNFAVLICR